MTRILFASFESQPFVKTGGLADAVEALATALDKKEYEVKVVLPLFKEIKENHKELKYVDNISVCSGLIKEEANIYSCNKDEVEFLFIENHNLYNREGVYGYKDDALRFSFFNYAIVEMMKKLGYYPDIIHEHDYHTAVLPAILKIKYNDHENLKNIKHVFTIHNLAYQGEYDKEVLFNYLGFDKKYYDSGELRFNDSCNFMKIGIVYADLITTVSYSYASEIQTQEQGRGLNMVLKYRKDCLYGIVNGINTKICDPSKDKLIDRRYSLKTYRKGKAINKQSLQSILGLKQNPDTMLVGMVSRLTFQKGIDIVLGCVERLLKKDIQVAMVGTGESKYEYAYKILEKQYPGKFAYYCGYTEEMAHKMYAGLDMLLMPSSFEPCGISQLIAMHYGTIPLVRETGGLRDTVIPYDEYNNQGDGFSFGPYSVQDFEYVFNYAYDQFKDNKKAWDMLIKNAMSKDLSFDKSARMYEDIYRKVLLK